VSRLMLGAVGAIRAVREGWIEAVHRGIDMCSLCGGSRALESHSALALQRKVRTGRRV